MRDLARHAAPQLLADQAAGGDEHGQLVQGGGQVDLAGVAPGVGVGLGLLLHHARVGAQSLVAQRREEETHLLVQDRRRHVVDDAGAEDGHRELVDLARAELVRGGGEERRVRARAQERRHPGARQPEREELAELGVAPPQQANRVAAQRQRVAEER